MIDAGILRQIAPRAPVTWVEPLNNAMVQFAIDQTGARQAAFLAQCAHESEGFLLTREIWGPTPDQIAYEGKKSLGNTQPGDGHLFLGRGVIQVTGRANYADCSLALYGDSRLLDHPEYLEQQPAAACSAGWFWQAHDLNNRADLGDFYGITKIINPGLLGMIDRLAYWKVAKTALGLT
jgi:putative chitinase